MLATTNGSKPELLSPLLPRPTEATNSAGDDKQRKVSIDHMLQRLCGEFGPWQLRHFMLTSLAWSLEAFHTTVMIFADLEPKWRCVDVSGRNSTATSVCGLGSGLWQWLGDPESSTAAEWGLFYRGMGDGNNGEERAHAWPKMYISLSSKEKEDDYLRWRYASCPRDKKRAKIIQRSLLLVSPGAWFTDICRERFEVREKKSNKKRPRGLKAMVCFISRYRRRRSEGGRRKRGKGSG